MSISTRFTSSDLELLRDRDDVRYEVVDGELFVAKTPHFEHQYASASICVALGNWTKATGMGVVLATPGVIFGPEDDVIPDVIWISHGRIATGVDEAGHFRVAPELVIEVLSAGAYNERRDRDVKLKLYSRYGVHEYWIVDWRMQIVQVYRREQAALQLVGTLDGADELTSPLLPGFHCPLSELWYTPK
jgi:Uma2 family endonuclease